MDKEYAAAIGGRVTDLLTENAEAIEGAFKAHGDTLKISVGVILSTRDSVQGGVNRAAVVLSFDPYPKEKAAEKIKDQISFEWK
jgi:hypothetical protein